MEQEDTKRHLAKIHLPKSRKLKILLGVAVTLLLILIVSGVLLAIPQTRYGILGKFVKKTAVIDIIDSQTGEPVSNADVEIGDTTKRSSAQGVVRFPNLPVGDTKITISKKYYKTTGSNIHVYIITRPNNYSYKLVAIGRQVTVKVINKITGQAVAKATVSSLGTSAETAVDGDATIVLPADKAAGDAIVKADGFNEATVRIKNVEQLTAENTFAIVPIGKIYFLSKITGTINLMSSDLDGANKQIILQGTDRENDYNTIISVSQDWKYIALLAQRDTDHQGMYLIKTADGSVSTVDDTKQTFAIQGWTGSRLVYTTTDNDTSWWQQKQRLVSFNAVDGSKTTLAENQPNANASQNSYFFDTVGPAQTIGDEVVYVKSWAASWTGYISDKKAEVFVVKADGSDKRSLGQFSTTYTKDNQTNFNYIYVSQASPIRLIISTQDNGTTYYEYIGANLNKLDGYIPKNFTPQYLVSPAGNKTLWSEPRDGKQTIFVGDAAGNNGKILTQLSDFIPYGWANENYILLSKQGSELYIAPADFSSQPVKVTDYHKPASYYYGGGAAGN